MSTKISFKFCRVTIRRDSVTNKKNLYAVKEDNTFSEIAMPITMSEAIRMALVDQLNMMSPGDEIEIILLKKGVFNG